MNKFMPGSDTVTHGIRVKVAPEYMAERSEPEMSHFLFTYHVTITNESAEGIHLLSRKWIIIDAEGGREEVEGDGVAGFTPYIEPGNTFEYDSFCPLPTEWGTMEGSYTMKKENGETIEVEIGRFYLCDLTYA